MVLSCIMVRDVYLIKNISAKTRYKVDHSTWGGGTNARFSERDARRRDRDAAAAIYADMRRCVDHALKTTVTSLAALHHVHGQHENGNHHV